MEGDSDKLTLDASLKRRRVVRALITKFLKTIAEEYEEKNTAFWKRVEELDELDNKIMELMMCTDAAEDELMQEMEKVDEYRIQIDSIRRRFEEKLGSVNEATSVENDNGSVAVSLCREPSVGFQLPKIVLECFDLGPSNYTNFWTQFQRIDSKNIPDEDKFLYLKMSLKGNAKKLVDSYPNTAGNYVKALAHLKQRFGREEMIINCLYKELLGFVRSELNVVELYDNISSKLRVLETLGLNQERIAILIPLIEECLPVEILKLWERSKVENDQNNDNSVEKLMNFICKEAEAFERLGNIKSTSKNKCKTLSTNPTESVPTAAALYASNKQNTMFCVFCNSEQVHESNKCTNALKWTLEERFARVKEKRLCFLCLRGPHRISVCRSKAKCQECCGRHSSLLCRRKYGQNKTADGCTSSSPTLYAGNVMDRIYLKILVVRACVKGQETYVRVLLDDGCSRSYITKDLVKKLGLVASGQECTTHTLFGGVTTDIINHNKYNLLLKDVDCKFSCQVSLLDQPQICCKIPQVSDSALLLMLKSRHITIADIKEGEAPPIDILLGAQDIGKLLTGRVEVFPCGISAIETKLGWCVLGCNKKKSTEIVNFCMLSITEKQVPKLWELETLGIENINLESVDNDAKCTQLFFDETLAKNKEGRYEVRLPWRIGHPSLSSHKLLAEARLKSVTNKLKKQGLFDVYDDVFKSWLNDNIIEKAADCNPTGVLHYLPHRPVFKDSAKTKCRPVFDAGARQNGISLNECLSPGPNLLEELPGILLRFRVGSIGVVSDIRQAFCMISMHPEDRDALRFLWWTDANKIIEYRHTRVVFGVTSSPFLLNATLQHLIKSDIRYPETTSKLLTSFYCDDCVTSVNSVNELLTFKEQAMKILNEGKFELRGWVSSSPLIGQNEDRPTVHSVLGLSWNVSGDFLFCSSNVNYSEENLWTKRSLLSIISKVFDPLGLLCAALIVPKLLLQEAWRRGLSWDEQLPPDLASKFKKWYSTFNCVNECAIKRRIHHGSDNMECCSLHVFVDGSGGAYATCIYLRCTYGGRVALYLVAAKARVGPVKGCSIPRMELLAFTIGVRLANAVLRSLNINIPKFFWSDSTVVLTWLSKSVVWKTWVGNRVNEIKANSSIKEYRYVPTSMNWADLPSRGCDFLTLRDGNWLQGPEWLLREESSWPEQKIEVPAEALVEAKGPMHNNNMTMSVVSEGCFSDVILRRFSSYKRILRLVAFILRFHFNTRALKTNKPRRLGPLSYDEICESESVIFKLVQSEWSEEDRAKRLSSLDVVEREGLIRVKTRLLLTDEADSFKYPVVLPDHPLSRLLILYQHFNGKHAGVQTTLNILRGTVWVVPGRRTVKSVLHGCLNCKKMKAVAGSSIPAPLPRDRVFCGAAFETTGVDLGGPLFLKGGSKVWVVLFTCATYRAIHLELCTSLSTEFFLMALRRFIARRNKPKLIRSDLGTNFVGASNQLKAIDWSKIAEEAAVEKIVWKFNPAASPWYGGWFERLIGVVKDLLRKNLGRCSLTYEELLTLLCSCEQIINERPLTYCYNDNRELRPLTPSMFLYETSNEPPLELEIIEQSSLVKRILYRQELREKFKRRFREEYLAWLVNRPHKGDVNPIKVGEVVLVGADNVKRVLWPLGRVMEVFTGADGVSRVARVRLANSEIVRPIQRLYKLEVSHDDSVEAAIRAKVSKDTSRSEFIDDAVEAAIDADASRSEFIDNCVEDAIGAEVSTGTPRSEIIASPESLPLITNRGRVVKRPKKLDL